MPDHARPASRPLRQAVIGALAAALVASLAACQIPDRAAQPAQGGSPVAAMPSQPGTSASPAPSHETTRPTSPSPTADGVVRMPPHWSPSEAVIHTLNGYGRDHRDTFGGLYIDRETHAGIVMLFTEDAATHEAALRAILPDTPLTVETVRFSEAELLELQQRLVQDSDWLRSTGFTMYSMSVDIMDNLAELTGATNGPRAKERIHERYGREMLRIVAHDMVAEPEQPLEGDGWRLLAELPRGGIYSVAAFTDEESFRREWRRLEAGAVPPVDFGEEIVIRFSPAMSGSCRHVHFAGLVVTGDRVHGDITFPVPPDMSCTADANPYAFVVAVERSVLPDSPFTLQLFEKIVGGDAEQRVTVDLGD
ncbi:hypothetical protein BH20CHL5_BH20CHL5_13890 [soil metagenome]